MIKHDHCISYTESFVSDMPGVAKSPLYMFADDVQLNARVDVTDGTSLLQDDLNTLSARADTWQLTFRWFSARLQ